MNHFERLDAYFGCGSTQTPCEKCDHVVCTCDDVSPCARCGHDVISEIGATRTEDGWVHDLCAASYKQFGPMYPKEAA